MISLPIFTIQPDAPQWAKDLASQLNTQRAQIVAYMNRVPQCDYFDANISVADAAFLVPHTLNATPKFAQGSGDVNAHVYWTPDDKREWGPKSIKVRYPSTGHVTIRIEA